MIALQTLPWRIIGIAVAITALVLALLAWRCGHAAQQQTAARAATHQAQATHDDITDAANAAAAAQVNEAARAATLNEVQHDIQTSQNVGDIDAAGRRGLRASDR